jgi:hypothetical protein
MARLKGLLKIEGSTGGFSFYKLGDVIVVRQGWGPDKKRMQKDPAFERARENGKEFGACAKDGKLLRNALRSFVKTSADKFLTPRVTKTLFAIKNLDSTSRRGERCVAKGIVAPGAEKLLKDLLFNKDAPLGSVLKCDLKAELKSGRLRIEKFLAKQDLYFPKGATHARLRSGMARIDFENKTYEFQEASAVVVSKKETTRDVVFKIPSLSLNKGTKLMVFGIHFLQERNGELYALNDSQFTTFGIVGVE